MKKICLLVLFILACYPFILSVRNSQATDTQEGWKFRIVDDWGLWGNEVVKYDPVGGSFGAVAYLYNSTKPVRWTGEWSFENWFLIKSEEADTGGWVAFHELPTAWDNSAPNTEINYTLILKLKIGGDITPITIFNATILRVNYNGTDKRNLIGLKDLIQKSLVAHPSHRYPGKDWIQGITPSFIESGYACFKVWLYYVALQPLDELGFPITGTTLEVKYDSSPNGITYIGNQKVAGWKDKLYGKWITNGSLGSEFIFDTTYIYHANYKVGWVILRVPLINETTAGNSKYRSSLVSNLTFIWRFKSDTPINVTKYYEMKPINFVPPYPWGHLKSANPPTLGAYSSYLGLLMVNSSHRVNALVRWVMLNLTDCFGNNWWTVKAEAYAFDNADKNHYMLAATRVGPGRYILRYPVPTYPFGNTTLTLGVEWYYSLVNVSRWKVGYTWPPHPNGYRIYDELNPAGWKSNIPSPYPRGILGVDNYWQQRSRRIRNNMTWVDVNFHSSTELPEELPDFVAKIWLPATIGYRKAENLTVRWNGRNGYVVLPDMEYYAGPNPATIPQLDPYSIAGLEGFDHFYEAMIQYFGTAGRFGGNGWLPTREVGWVDFEAWYEGTKVLDTYADGNSLKLECCEANPPDPTTCHYSFTLKIYEHWQRWYNRTITIKADGTIDPRDAPIIRDGDTYSLTANVEVTSKEGIIVEKDNIIIDGNNHRLRGGGEYDENKYIWGILLIEKKNVTIKKMVIQGFKIGICLSDALNNIIIENNLTNNWCGIFLEEFQARAHNNIMIANNIMNNEYGIYIEYSSNNRILENNIVNNTYGIFLDASSNEIYHNNFICNKRQADTSGAANIWNENYWNDYKGMDTDNDGFGNIPYVINKNNGDERPLMNPFKKYLASDYYFINVVTSYGTATGSGCYKPGTTATISISSTIIDHGNGTRHVFTGWYEKGRLITANQSFIITVTESRSIAAEWSTQYEIKTSTQYGDVNGSGWYKPGETVTISISSTQAERYFFNVVFEGWEINGKVVSTSPTYYFTVDNPVTLVASWRTEVKPVAIGLISGIIILIIATTAFLIVKRKLKPSPPQPQPSPTPPTPIETEIEKEIRKLEEYLERLEQLRKEGKVSEQVYERLKQEYEKKLEELIEKLKK